MSSSDGSREERSYHPEYPFWRLQTDRVWAVHAPESIRTRQSNTDPPKGELLAHDVHASFSDDVKIALTDDPHLVAQIAWRLLERHFPESIHPDILSAVGLSLTREGSPERKRDPEFRQRILTAYEWRCAVCGLDIRLGTLSVGLDAAHIRWHQAGGPAEENNGLALCMLHHKLFDLGVYTLDAEGGLLVSDQAHGTVGFLEALLRHHGRSIRRPQRAAWSSKVEHLTWHREQVFKGQPRDREVLSLGSSQVISTPMTTWKK